MNRQSRHQWTIFRTALAFLLLVAVSLTGAGAAYAGTITQHAEWVSGEAIGPLPGVKPGPYAGIESKYDVIVAGTDPEGVAAAVSAARNGLKVLLADGRGRTEYGGLMTLGWLNSLDMNRYGPNRDILNKGIFTEWYGMVEGDSFDVRTAAVAFRKLVEGEPNIDVLMPVERMEPILEAVTVPSKAIRTVTGMRFVTEAGTELMVQAPAVIDATQDGDIAAAAGVPYTFGREDIGNKKARMAVTLVFRLEGVTPDVWTGIRQRLRGTQGVGSTEWSAWGYKELYNYKPTQPNTMMRGLNIGRQKDNTALINALLVFGVDPLDPESVRKGMENGQAELPYVIAHLKRTYPEFANITLGEVAPELYVRESRHIQGEYRLNVIDLLENRDHWDRIAFGSYPIDLQPTSPGDNGAILFKPLKYAVPFRSIVPQQVDGLLVVGRAASFDTLPHGSARTIPVGMATGQAAGAAVKLALEQGLTFRELSQSETAVRTLQARLNTQGMELQPYTIPASMTPYMQHRTYLGLKAVVYLGLVSGKYDNDFSLDATANRRAFAELLAGAQGYFRDKLPGSSAAWLPADEAARESMETIPLTLARASIMMAAALKVQVTPETATETLIEKGYLTPAAVQSVRNPQNVTVGESFLLFRDMGKALGLQIPR